jgi:hypothetical protein
MSGNGKYGAGLSIDGVIGGEVGTEQNPLSKKGAKPSIGKFVKSLFKTSLTANLGFNWTKEGVTDVQNGLSDPQVGNLIRPPIIKSNKRTTQLQGKKCITKTVKLLWVA